jgi:hypothetical protein
MSQAELLLDRWRTLPPEQQQALMAVATELVAHPPALIPKRNLKGLWADHNIDLDEMENPQHLGYDRIHQGSRDRRIRP